MRRTALSLVPYFCLMGALFLTSASTVQGQTSMTLSDRMVATGSNFSCLVTLVNDSAIAGYTCVTTFDPAIMSAVDANVDGLDIVSDLGPVQGPGENGGIEFFNTKLEPTYSSLACIFDLNFPFDGQSLPAGGPRTVARFVYSLVDDPLLVGQTLAVNLENNVGSPPLSNVVSLVGGISSFPALVSAIITVVDLPSFRRGDANSDGLVNIADAVFTIGFLFENGAAANCMLTMDQNSDTFVDISDMVYLVTYQFSGGPPPPAPFPDCGIDPSGGVDCTFYPAC